MFKYHQNSLSPSELRQVRLFKGAELPRDATVEGGVSAAKPSSSSEIYIGYAHIPRAGMAAAFLGKKADKWRVFPLSAAEWVRKGHLSPIFNKAQKQGMPLPSEELCFSILFHDNICLGLSGRFAGEVEGWVSGLKTLTAQAKHAVLGIAAAKSTSVAVPPAPTTTTSATTSTTTATSSRSTSANAAAVAASRAAKAAKLAKEAIAAATAAAAVDVRGSAPGGAWSEADIRNYYEKSLFSSIRAGRIEDVVLAFEGGCPTDIIEASSGDNALLAGARAGDVRIVKIALNAAVPFMPHGPSGENALQVACMGGNAACVEAIMRMAAEADDEDQPAYVLSLQTPDGDAPLHLAATGGFADIVKCLLRYSHTEVSLRNGADRTPIHCVCAAVGAGGGGGGVVPLPRRLTMQRGHELLEVVAQRTLIMRQHSSCFCVPRGVEGVYSATVT